MNTADFHQITIHDRPTFDLTPQGLTEIFRCASDEKPSPIIRLDIMATKFTVANLLSAIENEPRLKHLQYVRFRDCPEFDDAAIEILAKHWKGLQHVAVPACSMTGVGVKSLVNGLPALLSLALDHCANINSDAIEWARAKGVKVSHKMY